MARSLGRDGLRIFLRARHTVAVTAELQREESPDAGGRSRDVRSTEQVDAAAVRYGPVDVLVNNTGRQQGREAPPPTDGHDGLTDKLRLDAVDTNLHSVFRVTRAAPATQGQGMPENARERITDIPSTGRKHGIVLTTPHPLSGLQARRRRLHQGPRTGTGRHRQHGQRPPPPDTPRHITTADPREIRGGVGHHDRHGPRTVPHEDPARPPHHPKRWPARSATGPPTRPRPTPPKPSRLRLPRLPLTREPRAPARPRPNGPSDTGRGGMPQPHTSPGHARPHPIRSRPGPDPQAFP
nr:SDR family NAD(P)-dependent oxidoreductase [Streptomyces sp. SM18]